MVHLSGRPEAAQIVLGGYFALQHYVAYRLTHDINAWWRERASPAAEHAIGEAMRVVADASGLEVRERRFGETVSYELLKEGAKSFSFQIAVRSVALEAPIGSAGPPILLETLTDNIGLKMNALVDRGAPRDFIDIRKAVGAALISASECWVLL